MTQLLGCAKNLDYELDASSFDPTAMKLVEENTGLQLPPGARGLNLLYSGNEIDPSFLARIEIPATEQASLTRDIETKSEAGGASISADQLKTRVAWWHPEKGTLLIDRVYGHQMNGVQLLLCEEDRHHVLYILWVKV